MSKMQINQYIYINTENPFFEKLHLLKSHLLNQKTKDLVEKNKSREMTGILMSLLPIRSQKTKSTPDKVTGNKKYTVNCLGICLILIYNNLVTIIILKILNYSFSVR